MSSSTSTTTPLPSSPTASSGGNDVGAQRGANYFFGFLITFVGLLFILFTCGIGSRRRFGARREAVVSGTLGPFRHILNEKPQVPPQFYEYSLLIGGHKWSNLMPLSAKFWTKEKENGCKSAAHDLREPLSATPARRNTHCYIFPSFLLPNPFRHQNPSLKTQPDPETIEVAVMIFMPYKYRSLQPLRSPDRLPEYQIGNIYLPWRQPDIL